jgi:mannose-6-phosphate isomerase-like protein (cupin superfamily)
VNDISWGEHEVIRHDGAYVIARLTLAPGRKLAPADPSRRASQHLVVAKGRARVTRGPHEFELQANESVYIPASARYRLANASASEVLELIQIRVGQGADADSLALVDRDAGRA